MHVCVQGTRLDSSTHTLSYRKHTSIHDNDFIIFRQMHISNTGGGYIIFLFLSVEIWILGFCLCRCFSSFCTVIKFILQQGQPHNTFDKRCKTALTKMSFEYFKLALFLKFTSASSNKIIKHSQTNNLKDGIQLFFFKFIKHNRF